ncbi:MAG TPA: MlaD family protein [Kofleriaceae bacterium]|nr:MlaD family protein [Kofleriaceae bacterium]
MRWVTRLTTLAVLVIVIAGVALLIRSLVPTSKVEHATFKTSVKFRDGSRLAVGSPVVIAGVQVGLIRKLTIEGQLARIDMDLQDKLDLPVDSFATRRADSLFGDSYIEIIPSSAEEGAAPARLLRSGEPITHVIEGNSTDALLRAIDTTLPRIDNRLDQAHDAMIKARKLVSGPFDDKMHSAADWLANDHIEGPLATADHAMIRLDDLTTRGADRVARLGPEVDSALARFNRGVLDARAKMNDAKVGLANALADTRAGLDRVDPQIDQAAELMGAINDGESQDFAGKLGRLVNDPHLGEEIEDATEAVRDAAAGLNRFKSWLGVRVEYDVFSAQVRVYATAEIRARNDKFYLIEIERGPLGGVPNDQLSDAIGSNAFTRAQTIQDKPRFTAQFGKQLGRFALRGGLKDSTFGAGADAYLMNDRLKLSADVFGAFVPTPRVKLSASYAVFRTLYILAGVDDALNTPGYLPVITASNPAVPKVFDAVRYGRDYFLGATLSFTDADLAILIRVYGTLLAGLLTN